MPPPATISGRRERRSAAAASASSSSIGGGAANRTAGGAKNASGQSYAIVCTSCGIASVTGPHSAASVSTCSARGSAVSSCSGWTMRSK